MAGKEYKFEDFLHINRLRPCKISSGLRGLSKSGKKDVVRLLRAFSAYRTNNVPVKVPQEGYIHCRRKILT